MNRIITCLAVMLLSSACSQQVEATGETALNDARPAAPAAPQYASEAQRGRALNYWLPQNQLPPDAGVAQGGG